MSEALYLRVREITPKTLDLHVMQILQVGSERHRKIDLICFSQKSKERLCTHGMCVPLETSYTGAQGL